MNKDMCVACDDGILNIRVGAIIMKDGKILMVGNDRDYLYSVGGRVKFGETAEEAVVREVLEETGVQMEIDRLGFVHENYFYGDMPSNRNKLIYEISLFFYMKVPMLLRRSVKALWRITAKNIWYGLRSMRTLRCIQNSSRPN